EFCDKYRQLMQSAYTSWRQFPSHVCLVSYAELTREPERLLRQLCDFLGERFEDSMLEERSANPARWKIDPHLYGKLVTRTKNWADHISREEAEFIESELASLIQEMGMESVLVKA
ncbi:MAG: sulfotransferase, partial [bacterium]